MAIKLRVISDHYRELGENRSRVFGVNGGTIGRAPDNDWVLPDPGRPADDGGAGYLPRGPESLGV